MREILILFFEFVFICCVIYAMITDYRKLRIPNMVSIVLAGAFFPFAILAGPAIAIGPHLFLAGAVFILLFIFFAIGWLGGGDVKLVSAIMLWAGPPHGMNFVVLFAIFGGVFALALLSLRYALLQYPRIETVTGLGKMSRWARNGLCPYALPIGAAALCVAPAIFTRI